MTGGGDGNRTHVRTASNLKHYMLRNRLFIYHISESTIYDIRQFSDTIWLQNQVIWPECLIRLLYELVQRISTSMLTRAVFLRECSYRTMFCTYCFCPIFYEFSDKTRHALRILNNTSKPVRPQNFKEKICLHF